MTLKFAVTSIKALKLANGISVYLRFIINMKIWIPLQKKKKKDENMGTCQTFVQ